MWHSNNTTAASPPAPASAQVYRRSLLGKDHKIASVNPGYPHLPLELCMIRMGCFNLHFPVLSREQMNMTTAKTFIIIKMLK